MFAAFVDERGVERSSMYAKAVDERKAGAGKIFGSGRSLYPLVRPSISFASERPESRGPLSMLECTSWRALDW
jgi:hypothetical protein